jgi:ATP-dependent exoDNAse (exonuclease V) beta subunit
MQFLDQVLETSKDINQNIQITKRKEVLNNANRASAPRYPKKRNISKPSNENPREEKLNSEAYQKRPKLNNIDLFDPVKDDEDPKLDDQFPDISRIDYDSEENKDYGYDNYEGSSTGSASEEIFKLLDKAKSEKWTERITAFENLSKYVGK